MVKFIKALLLTVMLTFSVVPAYAGTVTIDVDSLSQEQIELVTSKASALVSEQKAITQKLTETADSGVTATINKAKEAVDAINAIDTSTWAGKGAAAGEAVVNFASKLGIAAADFATSGTGILIAIGVMLYYFGAKAIAITLFIAVSIVAYKLFGIIQGKKEEVLVSEKIDKNGQPVRKYKTVTRFHFDSADHRVGAMLTAGLFSIPSLILLAFIL